MSRINFNQFIYGRQKGKFAGSKKKKRWNDGNYITRE